jgi:hypothetical protein
MGKILNRQPEICYAVRFYTSKKFSVDFYQNRKNSTKQIQEILAFGGHHLYLQPCKFRRQPPIFGPAQERNQAMRRKWHLPLLLLLIGALGFIMGAIYQEQEKNPITREMVAATENLIGLQFNDAKRDSMLGDLKDNLDN